MLMGFMSVSAGGGSCSDRDGIGGEQIPDLDPVEAGPTWHGPVQGGFAHFHPGAEVLPGQAVGLLLPCRLPVRVRASRSSEIWRSQLH